MNCCKREISVRQTVMEIDQNSCRICLQLREERYLCTDLYKGKTLEEVFHVVTGRGIQDSVPKSFCVKCSESLLYCYDFLSICDETQVILESATRIEVTQGIENAAGVEITNEEVIEVNHDFEPILEQPEEKLTYEDIVRYKNTLVEPSENINTNGSQKFVCCICGNPNEFLIHKKDKHMEKELLICGFCQNEIRKAKPLLNRQQNNRELYRFSCKFCPFLAKDSLKLKKHYRRFHYSTKFQCTTCMYSTRNYLKFKKHGKIHAGKVGGSLAYKMRTGMK